MTGSPPPIDQLRPDIPPQLRNLVNWCLEKDVSRRCASVAELARGLAPFCPARSLPLIERISGVLGVRAVAPQPAGSFQQTGPLGSSMGPVVTNAPTGAWNGRGGQALQTT